MVMHIVEILARNFRRYSSDTALIEHALAGRKRQDISCKGFDDKVK